MGERSKPDPKKIEAASDERERRAEAKTVQIKKVASSGVVARSEMPTLSWKRTRGRA